MRNICSYRQLIPVSLQLLQRYSMLFVFLLSAVLMHAQWRTSGEALGVLNSAHGNKIMRRSATSKNAGQTDEKLLHVEKKDGHNAVYVFERGAGDGVVMVGGLEGTDILGYTEHGGFDADSMPPALKQLMAVWTDQQLLAAKHWGETGYRRVVSPQTATERPAIDHLIQTGWSQRKPYNDLCPDGCPTGCVATMFAQIMKYYNYPQRGAGSHSYSWGGKTYTADFGSTEYQWDKMLDNYARVSYSEEAGNAVATLMAHLGVALEMMYDQDGSAAYFRPEPIIEYFDYNKNANLRSITWTDDDVNLLYKQLELRHPIPFNGFGTGAGHAFIVDGYQDGLWGINWGWGPSYDGYFAPRAFKPDDSYDFSWNNNAIIDLVPNGAFVADKEGTDGDFTVTTPGTLKGMLGNTKYRKLKISGNINGDDLRELRARCCCRDTDYPSSVQGLKELDLSDANIVNGGVYYREMRYSGSNEFAAHDYEAKENVLGLGTFVSSNLQELRLPASVRRMETYAMSANLNLKKLTVPSSLETFEEGAISNTNPYLEIDVPEGGKPFVENGALYLENYKALCLLTGIHERFKIAAQCQVVYSSALWNGTCDVGTLIMPALLNEVSLQNTKVKRVWCVGQPYSIDVDSYDETAHIELFLPTEKMVKTTQKRTHENYITNIYVPENLIDAYRSDPVWTEYSDCFKVIDNMDICVDDTHLSVLEKLDMNIGEKLTLSPLIYDSRLVGEKTVWSSTDTDIVTIDDNGKICAIKTCVADIRLEKGDYTAICHVTVSPWPTVNVEQPGTLAKLLEGKAYTHIAVTGKINGDDIRELCARAGRTDDNCVAANMVLEAINLTDAEIVSGGVYFSSSDKDFTCKADTLTEKMFRSCSLLKILLLPRTVKAMERLSIVDCRNLQQLRLPEQLMCYEDDAIALQSQNYEVEIDAPATACVRGKEGMLYSNDFGTLYLCMANKNEIVVDYRCSKVCPLVFDIDNFHAETVVCPEVVTYYAYVADIKNLWIGGNVSSLSASAVNGKYKNIFLPNITDLVKLQYVADFHSCKAVYVPEKLLGKFQTDENWTKVAQSIQAIESCGLIAGSCSVLMPERFEMMKGTRTFVKPQLLDTRLLNNSEAIWTSRDNNIVAVDTKGMLTAVGVGETEVTVTIGGIDATSKVEVLPWPTIQVDEPGTLAGLVGDKTYTYLRIAGDINADDLYKLRRMCNARDISADGHWVSLDENAQLKYLDLKDASINSGGTYATFWGEARSIGLDDALPYYLFAYTKLKYLRLPAYASNSTQSSIAIGNFQLEYLEIPEDLPKITDRMFSSNSNLQTMIYTGRKFLIPSFEEGKARFENATLYVRNSLLEEFRSNSQYADAFKAIEPLDDELADGIDNVEKRQETEKCVIYNILGQRMSEMTEGINIINGKKVLKRR